MKEKMDLKKIAKTFNMTIIEFSSFLGYSKQALYQINNAEQGICTTRYYSALRLLKMQSDRMYEEDLKKALEAKELREQGILQMSEKVGATNVLKRSKVR